MKNRRKDKQNIKIYFFVGTTAEFIKLAPIVKEFKHRKINFKLITSGQTPINFDEFADYLGPIRANIAFKQKLQKSSLIFFSLWWISTFINALFSLRKEFRDLNKNNSCLIIHGDTASSLLGGLVGKFYGLKIAHIESGLRSFNFFEPIPEEIFRVINMKMSDILFCPNKWSVNNVKDYNAEIVNTEQNTLIEIFWWAIKQKSKKKISKYQNYYILYVRRQEHLYFKNWIKRVSKTVTENVDKNLICLFNINILNEEVYHYLRESLSKDKKKNLMADERRSYSDFMKLMNNAEFIATDGCTNQEDAYYMGLPLLALRNRTERIEGLGENTVISRGDEKIIKEFLNNYKKYKRRPIKIKNRPSKIIVDYLINKYK